MIQSVFQIVDATDPEQWYHLGVWTTLKDAMDALKDIQDPTDINPLYDHEWFRAELIHYPSGWDPEGGTTIQAREWEQRYDEATDTYFWREFPCKQPQS